MRSIRWPLLRFQAASAANFSPSAVVLEAKRCISERARNYWKREEIKSDVKLPAQVHRHAHNLEKCSCAHFYRSRPVDAAKIVRIALGRRKYMLLKL